MPASDADIDELKQLVRWAQGQTRAEPTCRALVEGLKRAIVFIETPAHIDARTRFVLAAIRQAWLHRQDDGWELIDRALNDWALSQIDPLINSSSR